MDVYEASLTLHNRHTGKLEIKPTVPIETTEDLSLAYTPGVAEPCRRIAEDADAAYRYTCKAHTVAVVSNGTAVLGLGSIGAVASLPVMEGKAALFKRFGDVDAFPVCVNCATPQELVATVRAIAPSFGGINLEDISSPDCFEVERQLEEELDIPVFHDDQHGTAVVVTAALLSALRLTGKKLADVRIVQNGPGAAGNAIIHMLLEAGATHITTCDEFGVLYPGRDNMDAYKQELAELTNPHGMQGSLADVVAGADVFIGTSRADVLTQDMVRSMNKDAIVFAMANPVPEIGYAEAIDAGAAVVGTGRSDTPNQINNLLCFPGLFKGALAVRARNITPEMKVAAAQAISSLVSDSELAPDYIIPSALDARVAHAVARAVAQAALDAGVARFPEGMASLTSADPASEDLC